MKTQETKNPETRPPGGIARTPRASHSAVLGCLLLAAPVPAQDAVPPTAAEPGPIHVTFVGNEGFLIEGGGRKVLVDALVGDLPAYVRQSGELRRQLETAAPPFDEVDLILITHFHADHFGPRAVARHLEASPATQVLTTPQAAARLRQAAKSPDELEPRLHAASPPTGKRIAFPSLRCEVLSSHHGKDRPEIQNNAYLFEVAGRRLLHLGDSEATQAELEVHALHANPLDIAFVPSWYLDAEPWLGSVEATIRPHHCVAMHLAPAWKTESTTRNQRDSRARAARIQERFPEVILFDAPLQRRTFFAPGR